MQCLREVGVIGKPQANDLFHDLFHGVTLRTGCSALRYTPAFLPAQSDPSTAALSLSQVRNSPVRMGSDSQQASGLQLVKVLERQQGHFMALWVTAFCPMCKHCAGGAHSAEGDWKATLHSRLQRIKAIQTNAQKLQESQCELRLTELSSDEEELTQNRQGQSLRFWPPCQTAFFLLQEKYYCVCIIKYIKTLQSRN